MTARELADRVLADDGRDLTDRVAVKGGKTVSRAEKLKAACARVGVPLADVLALLPESERAKVT